MAIQTFVICAVTDCESGWNIKLGPDEGDPWMTVDMADWEKPEVGDIIRIMLPQILNITYKQLCG